MLKVDGIDVYYEDLQALWKVSLEVREGEVVALVGSNGAGKSTTLRAISGVLRPARGYLEFAGEKLKRLPAHRIVELGIAHVPEGRRLFPLMSVLENLYLGSYPKAVRRQRSKALKSVFEIFPVLHERRNQLAGTLSGGEQQMVAIGRGLMARPRLLLLDEPSLGLAPMLVKEIFHVIERIRSDGVAVLLVEQNVGQALGLADRGYVLENGRIAMEGNGQELLKNQHLQKAYLGVA